MRRTTDAGSQPAASELVRDGPLDAHVWPAEATPPGVSDDVVPLKGLADSAASVLGSLVVLVLGLGAVGARVFVELARLGIGTLVGVDPDAYGPESWQTQPARRRVDTGMAKARLQGAAAHATNPGTTVVTFQAFAQDLPLWILRSADVIVAAGDTLQLMVWAGVLAAAFGKPLLQGAVFGEQWLAFVRKYPLSQSEVACPACAMGTREWSLAAERRGCDPNTARLQGIEPTRTLPPVCDLAASLLGGEILKAVLPGAARAGDAEEIAYCLLSHRVWQTTYARNLRCRCPHERWREVDVPAPPSEATLETLLGAVPSAALGGVGSPPLEIRGELPFASFTVCCRCGVQVAVRRFARAGDPVGQCACGEPLCAIPMGSRSAIPADDVRHCLGLPLSELGVRPGGAVRIVGEDGPTCFFVGTSPLAESMRLTTHHPTFRVRQACQKNRKSQLSALQRVMSRTAQQLSNKMGNVSLGKWFS
jgi:molybdopterin/thiamine biosynthesis adenylyltransferase